MSGSISSRGAREFVRAASAITLLTGAANALSQEDAVIVRATRVPKPTDELVNDVTVITREELSRAGQGSLATVLQSVPGVEITSNGGLGAASQIFIRGTNSGHTLVLIDGMRVGSATLA